MITLVYAVQKKFINKFKRNVKNRTTILTILLYFKKTVALFIFLALLLNMGWFKRLVIHLKLFLGIIKEKLLIGWA